LIVAGGAQAYLAAECVQEQPTTKTFEVCVGRIEGEITDLATAGILAVNLSYGPGILNASAIDDLLADVDLGSIDATIEGRLRDVFIRWSKTPLGCSPTLMPLPQETLSETELLATAGREEWATCEKLRASAAAAHLGPTTTGAFKVDPLAFDSNAAPFDLDVLTNLELMGVDGASGVAFTLDAA